MEIQNVLFDWLPSEAAENDAKQLEIPKKTKNNVLLNNKCLFNFLVDRDAVAALKEFQELSKLFLTERRFRYNICV